MLQFLSKNFNISQGSVLTDLRCGGDLTVLQITDETTSESIMRLSQNSFTRVTGMSLESSVFLFA